MHPHLFQKFAGTIHLNQKFHPNMTGKYLTDEALTLHSPMNDKNSKEFIMLQTPVQPKARPFFDQAYLGKEDFKK